jgi:hypothetical protein
VASFAFFEWAGKVYFLLAGVLVGNVWEAWRRSNRRTGARFPGGFIGLLREVAPGASPRRPASVHQPAS